MDNLLCTTATDMVVVVSPLIKTNWPALISQGRAGGRGKVFNCYCILILTEEPACFWAKLRVLPLIFKSLNSYSTVQNPTLSGVTSLYTNAFVKLHIASFLLENSVWPDSARISGSRFWTFCCLQYFLFELYGKYWYSIMSVQYEVVFSDMKCGPGQGRPNQMNTYPLSASSLASASLSTFLKNSTLPLSLTHSCSRNN